jgi:hypothetical protein
MTDTDEERRSEDKRVDEIVRSGPRGALTIAGIAVAIVFLMWFLFYFFAFLPRGVIH